MIHTLFRESSNKERLTAAAAETDCCFWENIRLLTACSGTTGHINWELTEDFRRFCTGEGKGAELEMKCLHFYSPLYQLYFYWIFGQGRQCYILLIKVGSLSDVGVLFYHSLYLCYFSAQHILMHMLCQYEFQLIYAVKHPVHKHFHDTNLNA